MIRWAGGRSAQGEALALVVRVESRQPAVAALRGYGTLIKSMAVSRAVRPRESGRAAAPCRDGKRSDEKSQEFATLSEIETIRVALSKLTA